MSLVALRPGNSLTILIDGFVNRLQELSFLPSCYSSYGAWTLTPVGLAPTDHASFRWTHRLPVLIFLGSPKLSWMSAWGSFATVDNQSLDRASFGTDFSRSSLATFLARRTDADGGRQIA